MTGLNTACSVVIRGTCGKIGGHDELAKEYWPDSQVSSTKKGRSVLLDEIKVFGGVFNEEPRLSHGHGECAVGAGGWCQPFISELHILCVVGADRNDFLAAVAGFGHPVGIGGAGQWNVGTPHHQVAGVEPVPGFWNVSLVAKYLG